jgi:KUP system potassium uptake protein
VEDLQSTGEMPIQNKEYSIYGPGPVGTFKFGYILKSVSNSNALSGLDEFVLRTKYAVRKLAGSKIKWYGLETSSIIEETVPLVIGGNRGDQRIQRK